MPIIPVTPQDPDALAPPAVVASVRATEDGPPPPLAKLAPQAAAPLAPAPARRAPSMLVGKGRHLVTGGVSMSLLGAGGVAWALDPSTVEPSSPLMLAPAFTLAAQALMALIGYLRDYGAERMEAEKQRTADAQERAREAAAKAEALEAQIARMEKERDDEQKAKLAEALEEIKRLRG